MKKNIFRWIWCLVAGLLLLGSCPVAAQQLELSAQSAVVLSGGTGAVLFEKDAYTPRPIASTTKIMTALLALEAAQKLGDPVVSITREMVAVEGSSMGLREGDEISLTGLAAGMLLASGNDAANAAAIYLAGSPQAFAEQMNRRALELGMENTHFVTPSGLDATDEEGRAHRSTAYDLALLAVEALKNPQFRQLCSQPSYTVEFAAPVKQVTYTNHNRLLTEYPGCIGVKTGFTKAAGRCLVSAAEREGALVVAVTLDAPNDWADHETLLDHGFFQVEPYRLAGGDVKLTLPVVGSSKEWVPLQGGDGGTVFLPRNTQDQVERRVYVPAFLYAPVSVGQAVGEVRWYWNGVLLGSAPVMAGGCAPVLEG